MASISERPIAASQPQGGAPLTPRSGPFALTCLVPAFNEQAVIEPFLRALKATLQPLAEAVEIIVIDDGSRDATGAIVARLAPELGLTLLGLSRNFGKEAAMTAGLAWARGDVVMVIDADFQEPLECVAPMLAQWQAGWDMVYAVRDSRHDEGLLKRLGTRAFYALLTRGGQIDIPADARDFRVMDRRVVDALNALPERNRFMKGLFAWVGFRATAFPIAVQERAGGQSSFPLRQLRRLAVTGMTAFSDMPLRVWAAVGGGIACFAFAWGTWIVVERLVWGVKIAGFATLAASVMFFAGMQLLSIGILGEYLARVYEEVKRRPLYVIGRLEQHSPLPARPAPSGPA